MTIDTVTLTNSIDLREVIGHDTEPGSGKRIFCPFCQTQHKGGGALQVWPDHFHCFGCGAHGDAIDYVMLRDKVDFVEACKRLGWNGAQQSPGEIAKAKADRELARQAEEQKRANKLDTLLAEFTADEIWQAFNRRMQSDHVAWWESQGIPADWQQYLRLGYTPDKAYYDKAGELRHSAAYTIPYFHQDFEFRNMQYRLQDPANPKDRYRFESGLKTTWYMTEPSKPLADSVIICEGAKKAIVCKVLGDTGDRVSVLGVPSKVDSGGVVDAVKDCAHVWIVLDPDAFDRPTNAPQDWKPPAVKMAEKIGKAARVVRLPFKSDDGFLMYGMDAEAWKNALRQARRYGE